MEINKNNLPQAINALRQCARENQNQPYGTGMVIISSLCNGTGLEEIAKAIKENKKD